MSIPEFAPKLKGVYSGPRPILHPSFMEISSVVFVLSCWETNKQTGVNILLETEIYSHFIYLFIEY